EPLHVDGVLELLERLERSVEEPGLRVPFGRGGLELVREPEALERAALDLLVRLTERRPLHLVVGGDGAVRVALVEQERRLGEAREDRRARSGELLLDVAVLLERLVAALLVRLEVRSVVDLVVVLVLRGLADLRVLRLDRL